MPDSKALDQVTSRPLKAPGMNCPALTKFWTKYVRFIVPLVNLLIIPTENVGSSSSLASSTPNIRGRIHQAKMRMSLASKALGTEEISTISQNSKRVTRDKGEKQSGTPR